MKAVIVHESPINFNFLTAKTLTQAAFDKHRRLYGNLPIGVQVNTSCQAVMVDVLKQLGISMAVSGHPYIPKNQHWLRIRPEGYRIFRSRLVEQDPTQAILTLLEDKNYQTGIGQVVRIAPRHKANMEHGNSKHAIVRTIEIRKKGCWVIVNLDPEVMPDEIWIAEPKQNTP